MTDVSLEIGRNEFVCLVGPSGCGKSTLLRLVAGLVPPSSGEIAIGGLRVTQPRAPNRIVFQGAALLPWAAIPGNAPVPPQVIDPRDRDLRCAAPALADA